MRRNIMQLNVISFRNDARDDVVRIEHPGIVSSVKYPSKSLGGFVEVQKCLGTKPPQNLYLHLNPQRPLSQQSASCAVKCNDVVLRITLPKVIGRRKRRPHSDLEDGLSPVLNLNRPSCAATLSQSLRDNKTRTHVEVVGSTCDVLRFREMLDFQYSSFDSPLTNDLKTKLLSKDYNKMITFDIAMKTFEDHVPMGMVPPPSFGQQSISYDYRYRQNPEVVTRTDQEGAQISTVNPRRTRAQMIVLRFNDPEVPEKARTEVPPESDLKSAQQALLRRLRAVMQQRPVATRRYILNSLGLSTRSDLNPITKYAVYQFGSGPWKDSLVEFGVDPRSKPEYRKYQTITFQKGAPNHSSSHTTRNRTLVDANARNFNDHIFDGLNSSPDVKTWQLCDVVDPDLVDLITMPSRNSCEPRTYGWLQNGVLAKYRTIMRDKLDRMNDGEIPDRQEYELILGLPNTVHKGNAEQISRAVGATTRDKQLLGMFRLAANLRNELGVFRSAVEDDENDEDELLEDELESIEGSTEDEDDSEQF